MRRNFVQWGSWDTVNIRFLRIIDPYDLNIPGSGTYFQVVCLLPLLDPVECLLLRVDTHGEAAGARRQDTILDGQLIGGKAFRRPPTQQYEHEVRLTLYITQL